MHLRFDLIQAVHAFRRGGGLALSAEVSDWDIARFVVLIGPKCNFQGNKIFEISLYAIVGRVERQSSAPWCWAEFRPAWQHSMDFSYTLDPFPGPGNLGQSVYMKCTKVPKYWRY